MSDRLRCAVIGTGMSGLEHLHSLISCPRAAAVAIAESQPQRAREIGERFKISRNYIDFRQLLEQPDVDAVTIATPNHLHATMAIEALKSRKHVLLEQPLATNLKDALKVVETARKMKRTLMLAQPWRFNRHTQLARALIERGDLGEIYHARCFWLRRNGISRIGSWSTQKQFSGGGCTYDPGAQLLDTCLHLLKDFDVTSVTAQTHSRFGMRTTGAASDSHKTDPTAVKPLCDVEDFSVALLKLKNGKTALMETGWGVLAPGDAREHGIDLLGTNAGLSLFPARLLRNGPDGFETIQLNSNKIPYSDNPVHHFVSCALDAKKPLVTLEESLKIQEVIEAIYLSTTTAKEVRLK